MEAAPSSAPGPAQNQVNPVVVAALTDAGFLVGVYAILYILVDASNFGRPSSGIFSVYALLAVIAGILMARSKYAVCRVVCLVALVLASGGMYYERGRLEQYHNWNYRRVLARYEKQAAVKASENAAQLTP